MRSAWLLWDGLHRTKGLQTTEISGMCMCLGILWNTWHWRKLQTNCYRQRGDSRGETSMMKVSYIVAMSNSYLMMEHAVRIHFDIDFWRYTAKDVMSYLSRIQPTQLVFSPPSIPFLLTIIRSHLLSFLLILIYTVFPPLRTSAVHYILCDWLSCCYSNRLWPPMLFPTSQQHTCTTEQTQ